MSKTEEDKVKLVENWSTTLIVEVKVEARDEKEAWRRLANMKMSHGAGVQVGPFHALGFDPVCPLCGGTVRTAGQNTPLDSVLCVKCGKVIRRKPK